METVVMSVVGADRPGIVELVSRIVHEHGANWEASRMAHLANRFAGILLISTEDARVDELVAALRGLEREGLRVIVERGGAADRHGQPLRLGLMGADRPGITHAITAALAARGVNIEELATEIVSAPDTGNAIFKLVADVRAPAELDPASLRHDLESIAADLMVDLALRVA
jgi:glycine cleavage system regulatory protein